MDPVHFSGKEILDMAVCIEENGLDFYRGAVKAVKGNELQELFTFLATEEVRHVDYFEGLKKLLDDSASYNVFDPYLEEESMYIKALADSNIFIDKDKGKDMASEIKSDDDALDWAIGFEKDSILFYTELLSMVRDKDRSLVRTIIAEEKKHIAKLTGFKTGKSH